MTARTSHSDPKSDGWANNKRRNAFSRTLRTICGKDVDPNSGSIRKAGSIEANDMKKTRGEMSTISRYGTTLETWPSPNPMPQNARTRPKDCCVSPWRATNAVPFAMFQSKTTTTPLRLKRSSTLSWQEFVERGDKTLTISGGEPTLLRRRLIALVTRACQRGIQYENCKPTLC